MPASSRLDRRRFSRFILPLEVRYETRCPVSGNLCQGQGTLKDISLTGSFFHVDQPVNFQPGQILSLTIAAPLPFFGNDKVSDLAVKGEVIRLEPPGPATSNMGVAVNFIQDLSFAAS